MAHLADLAFINDGSEILKAGTVIIKTGEQKNFANACDGFWIYRYTKAARQTNGQFAPGGLFPEFKAIVLFCRGDGCCPQCPDALYSKGRRAHQGDSVGRLAAMHPYPEYKIRSEALKTI